MHPFLELPGRLVGFVLLLLGVAWAVGWRRSAEPKERDLAPFGGLFALGGVVLLLGVIPAARTIRWPTYGFCMAMGCVVLATLTIYWARKSRLMSMEHMIEMLLITGVCGLIGARCVYLVEAWDTRFADRSPAMVVAEISSPLVKGDDLRLATHGDPSFAIRFEGGEDLAAVKARIEEQGAAHDLIVKAKTTQHRGDEGIVVTQRGFLLKTNKRGEDAEIRVLGGSAAPKLGLVANSYTKGVAIPFSMIFNLRAGGLTYFGSVIGVLLSAAFYLRFRKVSFLRMLDLVAPALPLGLFFGRLGCLANGCCWGREAGPNALLSVQFPTWSPAWSQYATERLSCAADPLLAKRELTPEITEAMGSMVELTPPLHATQLYEGVTVLLIFFVLLAYRRWFQTRVGQAFAVVVLLQAPVRFVVEHFRRDHEVFFTIAGYPFTESQLVALTMFSIALPATIYLSLRGRPLSEVQAELAAADAASEPAPEGAAATAEAAAEAAEDASAEEPRDA